jgi:very-short-patch-repair endonuclease
LEGITRERAREMRTNQTSAEKLLWSHLRRKNISGSKFRRQHPLYGFIGDFCCIQHRLVVELDGDSHAEQPDYDAWRTERLVQCAFRVLRFFNEEVKNNLDGVIEAIWQAVQAPLLYPPPCQTTGEGSGNKANH